MDLNASPVSVSTSDSRPMSVSPVMVTPGAEPATVEIKDGGSFSVAPVMVTAGAAPATVEINDGESLEKKRDERSRMYDTKGKSIVLSERQEDSSRMYDTKGKSIVLSERHEDSSRLMKGVGGGGDFKAHIFVVHPKEDIIGKIMSFTKNGSRSVCVLSANGEICNVKIQPLSFNSKVLTFKDSYEIISLSGTMAVSQSGEVRNETGGWRITIGGSDGFVFAGRLFGKLIAASPVQVVVGSFWPIVQNPSWYRSNESRAMIVAPTTQNGLMGSTLTRQDKQPEMGNPPPRSMNRDLCGTGSGLNKNSCPNLNE
ncbi:unnamed protein product [Microthlaspi erraticum]|uniref:AT-hook motif nuclear-localized protein n=1 Tax=Microthlaspi erraticum TaxID=1685480 RepID=A0A6D2JQK6_9BRAS|nr:unnamed protein product [Microthlaspi erraticum]